MTNIRQVELRIAPDVFDLVAPNGKAYVNKILGLKVGEKVIFSTHRWKDGVKLETPIVETEDDFELIDLESDDKNDTI